MSDFLFAMVLRFFDTPLQAKKRSCSRGFTAGMFADVNVAFVVIFRDADTQTKRESSTNVPKPSTFVAGLRGCNSTKTTMNVVDLTLDVDQT